MVTGCRLEVDPAAAGTKRAFDETEPFQTFRTEEQLRQGAQRLVAGKTERGQQEVEDGFKKKLVASVKSRDGSGGRLVTF
jgi:hypothetical protein